MNRREFLATVGGASAASVAGCSDIVSDSEGESKVRDSSSDRVEFVTHRLATIGTTPFPGQEPLDRDGSDPNGSDNNGSTGTADISGAISGRIKNVSDSTIALLRIDAWFYDTDGGRQQLGQESIELEDIEPNRERSFFITILDRETTADVDDYEIAATVVE